MFNTLEEYYIFLNEDKFLKGIIGLSSNLKPLQEKLVLEEAKKHCFIEICFNDFNFRKGEYIPLFSSGSNCYPDLEAFDNVEYLKQRALNCFNPKYNSKYFHLLYHKTKDKREAIKSIESYLEFLKNSDLGLNDNSEIKGFIDAFDNLIHLVEKVKYDKKDYVIQYVKNIILEDRVKSFCLFHIIDFVTKNMKLTTDVKQFFFDIVQAELNTIQYPEHREDFLKLIIDLAQKIGKPQQEYQNRLGEYYLQKAEKEKGSLIVHSIYFEALKVFKKAGNKTKQDEVSKLMQDEKNNLVLGTITTKISNSKIDKYFRLLDKATSELTANNNSESIFGYLINAKNIFPKASMLEMNTKSQLQDIFTTITFDKNKNLSINNSEGINSYQTHFQISTLNHLKQIFYKGQINGKISYESLKVYMVNYTWYNDEIEVIEPNGINNSFKWIDFILPPIKLFFEQSEKDIENKSQTHEGYILAIDSLALKFEGVLRFFSNKIGAQIIESDNTKTVQRIDFDKMFDNEKFKSVIPEDDIAFFKFLFTRKGIDLRNNVAHSFYVPKDYSASTVWLLICAYLKLGDFNFKENSQNG